MYVAMDGLFKADAAPLRLHFKESLYGDVPMVVPAVLDKTYSQVSYVARAMSSTRGY